MNFGKMTIILSTVYSFYPLTVDSTQYVNFESAVNPVYWETHKLPFQKKKLD